MKNETKTARNDAGHKRVIWAFDSDNSIISVDDKSVSADAEKPFSFLLKRYKDEDTHIESMQIISFVDGTENGTVSTSIDRLEKDIFQLKKYGVAIGDTYFRDLVNIIRNSYLRIKVEKITLAEDERFKDLIELVKEYVSADKKLMEKGLCYVPVAMLDDLAADSGFKAFEMQALRKQLDDGKYILVGKNRYTVLKRLKDRPERVIAFYADKLGLENTESTQENNKDEA